MLVQLRFEHMAISNKCNVKRCCQLSPDKSDSWVLNKIEVIFVEWDQTNPVTFCSDCDAAKFNIGSMVNTNWMYTSQEKVVYKIRTSTSELKYM